LQAEQNEVAATRMLDRLPVVLVGLVLFICPFAFLPFTYHATYVKYTIFQTALLLLLLCFVARLLGVFPFSWARPASRGRHAVLAAVFACLFFWINFLSIAWSGFPKASLLRVLELGFYVAWFLLVTGFVVRRRQVASLGWVYVVAAIVTSIGAFLAYYLREQLQFISPFQGRIGFPAGNPIFLAGYLLPPLFISGFAAARWLFPKAFGAEPRSRSVWKSLVLALVAAFFLYAIYSTRSQSGWIGLAFACVAVLLFVGVRFGWSLAVELLAALFFFTVFAGIILYHFPDKWISLSLLTALVVLVFLIVLLPRLRRAFPYFSFVFSAVVAAAYFIAVVKPTLPQLFAEKVVQMSTVAVRLVVYGGAWRMVVERPLIGWGTGTFVCNYPMFAAPEQFIVNRFGTSALNVHNEPLHIAVEVGFVGLALAALMVWFIFRTAWRSLRAERVDAPILVGWGIFIGTIGMLVQELASVGLRFWDYAPFVWTNFALLVALAPAAPESLRPPEKLRLRSRLPWLPAFLVVVVALGMFWNVVVLGDLLSQKHRKDAALFWETALQTLNVELQQRSLTDRLREHGLPGQGKSSAFLTTALAASKQNYLQAVRDQCDLAISKSLSMENMLHAYYDKALAFWRDGKFAQAAAVLEELQREAPNISDTRFVLGDYYELAGNLPKAVVNFAVYRHQIPYDQDRDSNSARQALETLIPRLKPEEAAAARVELSQILETFRRDSAYSHLVISALFEKEERKKSAAAELEVVFKMGVRAPDVLKKLFILWDEAGEPQHARFWLDRGRKMFPNDDSFDKLLETPKKPP